MQVGETVELCNQVHLAFVLGQKTAAAAGLPNDAKLDKSFKVLCDTCQNCSASDELSAAPSVT